ncbi:MAG: hypothetical protein ACFFBC_00470 [Promethearchaeota archaeon]
MEDKTIFEKLKSEKWNYKARIITEDRIKDILLEKILNKARRFVCLITPFWTWAAVNELKLLKFFEENSGKINIILIGRENVNKYFHNRAIFNHTFSKLDIRNCWVVKNLHTKLYFNEKYILLTSANMTASSLELTKDKSKYNFEEAVLLKLKPIEFEKRAWYTFGNLNPFEIPPFVYIKDIRTFRKNRFLLGYGYKEVNKMEVPTVFSFPEMMEEWLLSEHTIETYKWKGIKGNKLLHLGEVEDFCPICKKEDCNFSRTFICHKYGIEYKNMKNHCMGPISDCNKGPFFESGTNFDQKCPITVFYCPNKELFYDPAKNKLICQGSLIKAQYGDYQNNFYKYVDPEIIAELDDEVDILSEECKQIDPIYYCSKCGRILKEDQDKIIQFDEFESAGSLYYCSTCDDYLIEQCPKCFRSFLPIKFASSYFYCEYCNREYYYHIENNW